MSTKNTNESSGISLKDDSDNILLRDDFRYSSLLRVKAACQTIVERKTKGRTGAAEIEVSFVEQDEEGDYTADSITIDEREVSAESAIGQEVMSIVRDVLEHQDLEEGESVHVAVSIDYADGYATEIAVSVTEADEDEDEDGEEDFDDSEDDESDDEDEDSRENPDEDEDDDSEDDESDDEDEDDDDQRENPDEDEEEEEPVPSRVNGRKRRNATAELFPKKRK